MDGLVDDRVDALGAQERDPGREADLAGARRDEVGEQRRR
jgi:hypothetical protein